MMKRLILPVLACGALLSASAAQLIVPMYAYPTASNALWNAVRDASSSVTITAIINPANGPGTTTDANYVQRVGELNTRGVKLAGYVYSSYGARPIEQIYADIDLWRTLYPQVTQLFVDEQSVDLTTLSYYQAIYDYAASRGFTRVIANPGAPTDEAFTLSPSIPVTTVLYESPQNGWITYTTPTYVASRPKTDFGVIVTAVGTTTKMRECVDLAKSRNMDYIFVTNDKGTNPYDTAPSYWSAEVTRVAAP